MPAIRDSWTCCTEFGRVYEVKQGRSIPKQMRNCMENFALPEMKKRQYR
jgi:hypothetical protein